MRRLLFLPVSALLLGSAFTLPARAAEPLPAATVQAVAAEYAALVYVTYWEAYRDAQTLQKAVDAFLAAPSAETMEAAKAAWLKSRDSYGQSEAFRFYEGPIDFVDEKTGEEGPEGRLNAWPLNEAYIDYVQGNPKAGIIQDTRLPITRETLMKKNQGEDEADITTGYHAIEFLLWGQDLNKDGPGARPFTDYLPGDEIRQRRRTYLQEATALLVDDVYFLVKSWEPEEKNYAAEFVKRKDALSPILTGMVTLSGFELASERMATALDSGDQEDEHSCFSDNTHKDFIANEQGIANIFFASYGKEDKGTSLYDVLKQESPSLAEKLAAHIRQVQGMLAALPHPIDREILATPEDSPARAQMEAAIVALQQQADLLKEAGKALGVSVEMVSE